jgi:ADP-ribose pyrophosphatase YjhB (NUDIX family)
MPHDHSCHDPACGCGHDHAANPVGPRPPVSETSRPWRPVAQVRALAVGIFEREGQILCGPVHNDDGTIKGWRPLGGAIEFGERAAAALAREVREETAQEITDIRPVGVLENLFEHEGAAGHEIVFVLAARFANATLYEADQLAFREGDGPEMTAKWVSLAKARAGRMQLFPDGLADLL